MHVTLGDRCYRDFAWKLLSRQSHHDLAILHGYLVGRNRPVAGGALPVDQPECVIVQRAHHLLFIDEAVGERTAAVWADRLEGFQPATARPEYSHLLVADGEGTSFADRYLVYRAQPPRPHPGARQPPGLRPAHRTGTFGNSTSGSAS
jgi:hypothetical protein